MNKTGLQIQIRMDLCHLSFRKLIMIQEFTRKSFTTFFSQFFVSPEKNTSCSFQSNYKNCLNQYNIKDDFTFTVTASKILLNNRVWCLEMKCVAEGSKSEP
jgi:hypothetical protein